MNGLTYSRYYTRTAKEKENTMDDEKVLLSFEEACAMLPEGERVHTLVQLGSVLIGSDSSREAVLGLLREGRPELSGETATGMGHGLAVTRPDGIHLFIETRQP
jgi:hypothetical protein